MTADGRTTSATLLGEPLPVERPIAGQLRDLRDALRRLAADATDDPRPPALPRDLTRSDAVDILKALATASPQLVWPEGGRPRRGFRVHGDPAALAVALIASQGVELFAGADRDRLRACLAPGCLLYFVKDSTRRQWCSALCGNRVRVARHYRRHASKPVSISGEGR